MAQKRSLEDEVATAHMIQLDGNLSRDEALLAHLRNVHDTDARIQACMLISASDEGPTENNDIIRAVLDCLSHPNLALAAEAGATFRSWIMSFAESADSQTPGDVQSDARNVIVRRIYANCALPVMLGVAQRISTLLASRSVDLRVASHLIESLLLVFLSFAEEVPPALAQMNKNPSLIAFLTTILSSRSLLPISVILVELHFLLVVFDEQNAEKFVDPPDAARLGALFTSIVLSIDQTGFESSSISAEDCHAMHFCRMLARHLDIQLSSQQLPLSLKIEHIVAGLRHVVDCKPQDWPSDTLFNFWETACELLANSIVAFDNEEDVGDVDYSLLVDLVLLGTTRIVESAAAASAGGGHNAGAEEFGYAWLKAVSKSFGCLGNLVFNLQQDQDWKDRHILSHIITLMSTIHRCIDTKDQMMVEDCTTRTHPHDAIISAAQLLRNILRVQPASSFGTSLPVDFLCHLCEIYSFCDPLVVDLLPVIAMLNPAWAASSFSMSQCLLSQLSDPSYNSNSDRLLAASEAIEEIVALQTPSLALSVLADAASELISKPLTVISDQDQQEYIHQVLSSAIDLSATSMTDR